MLAGTSLHSELHCARCDSLEAKLAHLENEYAVAKAQLDFLKSHKTLAAGVAGETLIAAALNGTTMKFGAPHDVLASDNVTKVEVKLAKLNLAVRGQPTMRWNWGKISGESGNKDYDYIILIGEKDPRFSSLYLDKNSPYVFFLLTMEQALQITIPQNGGRYRGIQLTTDPSPRTSKASVLFTEFQTTYEDLALRFSV
jgi:hypothetical protein